MKRTAVKVTGKPKTNSGGAKQVVKMTHTMSKAKYDAMKKKKNTTSGGARRAVKR